MITLHPVSFNNTEDFSGTSYDAMSRDEKVQMIDESAREAHGGAYFQMLAVYEDENVVGFTNLFALSSHIISIGPEIKEHLRGKGYGYLALMQTLEYAQNRGYSIAVAQVREDNAASIALHEKCGFEIGTHCLSRHGKPIRIYIKRL